MLSAYVQGLNQTREQLGLYSQVVTQGGCQSTFKLRECIHYLRNMLSHVFVSNTKLSKHRNDLYSGSLRTAGRPKTILSTMEA